MTRRVLPALAVLLAACGDRGTAPPATETVTAPEVLFLVRNEVFSIRLDGTNRHSWGKVGDDRHRTGYPRFLPDGRAAVLADDTGAIFPYVAKGGQPWDRIALTNVTLNDALCGASVGGEPRLVFTTSPFSDAFPLSTLLYRLDVDHPQLEPVGYQGGAHGSAAGSLSEPAPYDDGRVLAVRSVRPDFDTPGRSSIEILRIDRPDGRTGGIDPTLTSERLATLDDGYLAHAPARLPDGRVVFIRVDPNNVSDTAIGEMLVIGLDNVTRSTGITGVLGLVVIGDRIVYEEGGMDSVSDLIVTDLSHPAVNLTQTPYVSEHLGWSE
jgi:hypothetical protein